MIAWLIEALIASTVLMIAVLLLRGPVRKAFGAQIAYALWLLPVLRLVLPPLPASWWQAAAVAPVQRATEQMAVLFVAPVTEAAAPTLPTLEPVLVPALAVLWGLGAVAFVGWHTLAHHRFCRRLLNRAHNRTEQAGVHIIETDAASGPLAFGVMRRYVAFPRDFAERYDADERDLALAHELGHHARGDLIANWIALVVLALHWFNPVAWRAFRAFRADQEIANDARVLAGMNPMLRHSYACAILKAAHPTFLSGTVSATCHLHTIDDLKGRLRMLTTTKTSRARLIAGAGVLSLCAAAGLGLTASGTAAVTKVRSTVENATGVDLASLDQSAAAPFAPPAAPVPPRTTTDAQPPRVASPAPSTPEQPLPPSSVAPVAPEEPTPPEASARAPGEARTTTTTVTVTKDGKRIVRYGRYVKLNRDGSYTMVGEIAPVPPMRTIPPMPAVPPMPALAAMRPLPPMPQISSRACGPVGADGKMVIKEQSAGGRRIIICNDRIAAAASKGAAMAANSAHIERDAYAHALSGLRDARARMLSDTDMSAEARKHALEGIDTAIKEVESDLARVQ
ncbi:M56 family metallopeptidase [Sphingomonas sp. MMS24-J45]|uniref:M56 family metallopeptidase n=1 Tax=Sphingomonas sp. MMS24-J45 TaxID=3238806 RepID=UPI00384DE69C